MRLIVNMLVIIVCYFIFASLFNSGFVLAGFLVLLAGIAFTLMSGRRTKIFNIIRDKLLK